MKLTEPVVQNIVRDYLISEGWKIEHESKGHEHGVDLKATKEDNVWYIEVKGCGSSNAMRNNYFLSVLGEILQRMEDPNAHYSIALPDMDQFRNLWEKLPQEAKQRTKISVLFVKEDKTISLLDI